MLIWLIPITVLVHQALLYADRGRFDPFDGRVLLDIAVLLICFYGALLDPDVRRFVERDSSFVLMLYGGLLALYVGLHLPRLWTGTIHERSPSQPAFPRVGVLVTLTVVYVVVSLEQLRRWAAAAGGVVEWLTGPRTGLYLEALEGGAGALLYIVAAASRVGLLVFIMVALRQGHRALALSLYLTALACIFAIFTTRAEVLLTLLLPIFYYHYAVRRIAVWKVVLVGLTALVLLSALNVYRVIGTGIDFDTGVGLVQVMLDAGLHRSSEYFAGPIARLWALREQGALPLEYGMNYLYILLTFVPRALWPAKPITSFEDRWTLITQGSLGAEGAAQVWVFTAWGEGLAQFDIPGAILNLFLYGLIARFALAECQRRPEFVLVGAFVSVFTALFLRGGVQALAVMVILHVGTLRLIEALAFRPLAALGPPPSVKASG